MRYLIMVLAALFLSACASGAGKKIDQDKFSHFVKGKTTYAEVVRELGEPSTVTRNADGSKMAMYSYGQTRVKPQTYIPIVGSFIGGTEMDTQTSLVYFDKKGVLTNYSASEGKL